MMWNDAHTKPEIVVLTKSDAVEAKKLKKDIKDILRLNKNVLYVSIIDDDVLKKFGDQLSVLLKEKA